MLTHAKHVARMLLKLHTFLSICKKVHIDDFVDVEHKHHGDG